MFRKTILAIAATAVIGAASLTPASAHGHHGFGHGFGFGGLGFGIGLLGASIAASAYTADQSCWQYQMVPTPRGYYRRILVNVCQ
jgi:hypothetical protein